MNAKGESVQDVAITRLTQEGVIRVAGADARAFLHAQLTNDIEQLGQDQARRAGWCTAKGRLLATLLVVPQSDAFLLLLPSELVTAVMKRLKMFILRSKVTLDDASAHWIQYGLFGSGALRALAAHSVQASGAVLTLARDRAAILIRIEGERFRILVPAESVAGLVERLGLPEVSETRWWLEEIRMGLPQVVAATQELFVPQMLNFEAVAGLDFKKGCYPGQEVVARSQYRGTLKRRTYLVDSSDALTSGMEVFHSGDLTQPAGRVVLAASLSDARHAALVELKISALDSGDLHAGDASGPLLRPGALPYPLDTEVV